MKLYAYGSRLSLKDLVEEVRPIPQLKSGQILLRMGAASLNYRDLAIARGHYHVGVSAPLIPLADGAGEVVEISPGVTRVKVGDLVCPNYMPDWIDGPVTPAKAARRLGGPTDGTLVEYMALGENDVVRVPAYLSAAEAATLPVAAVTAWHSMFEKASVLPGQTVLVTGAGGVSVAAIQLARAAGAEVIALARRPGALPDLLSAGAHHAIELSDGWQQKIGELARKGVDVVVDVVGGELVDKLLAPIRPGGTLHLIGYAGGTAVSFDMFNAIRRALTVHVGSGGSRTSFENMMRVYELHELHPVVGAVLPFGRAVDAFTMVERGGVTGKIVVDIATEEVVV